jgi:hypothetical protein
MVDQTPMWGAPDLYSEDDTGAGSMLKRGTSRNQREVYATHVCHHPYT